MSTHLLLEAALRSLVMGAIILVALRFMRIDQVRARRTAWLLALMGALAMPALVGAQIGPRLLPELGMSKPQAAIGLAAPYIEASAVTRAVAAQPAAVIQNAPVIENKSEQSVQLFDTAISLVVFGYCVVAAVLLLRLCAGVGFALRLRNRAERVIFSFDPELDARISSRIATPVTIASSVLLPRNYALWDAATLRIVLSHERAHVRQRDFYVHALAGLHCALFWFNPFSWWLQRQLSELGEALSDRAAVEQAESRACYAETLLAFATRARWPLAGVAMARVSNLTPRIERLLSDRGFERSFAGKQRLPFVAAGVVMLALLASTSMERVRAAQANGPLNAISIEASITSGLIAANGNTNSTNTVPNTDTNKDSNTRINTDTNTAQDQNADAAGATDSHAHKKSAKTHKVISNIDEHDEEGVVDSHEEGIVSIHTGHSNITVNRGNLLPSQSGDYIYFQHDGKPYLIQDPAILAQAQGMLEPIKELRQKQKELGRQQAALGEQQRAIAVEMHSIKWVETPEFKRQMAELQKTIQELDLPKLTAQIDQRALAEVQAHLGEIQARVGQIQGEFGAEQGKFGEQQGAIGEQQGKLGEQQALLGEQQRQIVEALKRQLQPLIEQAIREGKGKPIVN
ncbi:MAG TPA: M56 family metallopeptidase [Steroidobacteraceae bacterium]